MLPLAAVRRPMLIKLARPKSDHTMTNKLFIAEKPFFAADIARGRICARAYAR
jgi:hypothetical protein